MNTLIYFEKLLYRLLPGGQTTQLKPKTSFFASTCIQIRNEKDRILNTLGSTLLYITDTQEKMSKVRLLIQQLTTLSEKAAEPLRIEEIKGFDKVLSGASWKNLYKATYNALTEILTYLEHSCADMLDINIKAPLMHLYITRDKYSSYITDITEHLSKTAVPSRLVEITLQPLNELFLEGSKRTATYHRLLFLKKYVERLIALTTEVIDEAVLITSLQDLLLEFNFNTATYYKYFTQAIKRELDPLCIPDQKQRLLWWQKHINQLRVQPGLTYSLFNESIYVFLQNWITAELSYLKETAEISQSHKSPVEGNRWKTFKVQTQFSVPQLGNMLKLMVDAGLILNENKTELLEFWSTHFSTVQQKDVAAGSLRKNFYAEDAAVADSVRSILKQLIDQSNE